MAKRKIDKATLRQRIQELDIDNELKSQLLDAVSEQKKYGLVWEDHKEDAEEELREKIPVLKEDRQLAILSSPRGGQEGANHILIEGDNLHALTALTYTHEGMVDVIYIDPPYNTGNKDFVYNDSFVDSEDGYRHSKWLSFMEKRLHIAKKLLSDRGVIFISIDDNEQANLKLLCDEVFGEENFLASIIWQHSLQPKGYLDTFSLHHNYTIMYKKANYKLVPMERTDEDNKAYSNPDNDPKGPWRSGDVRNALYRPNLIYDIISPSGNIIKPCANGWRWSKETVQEKIRTGEIIFNSDETRIIRKIYLSTLEGRAPETIWFGKDVGTTREGIGELKDIFGKAPFDTPKPIRLLKRIMHFSNQRNATILDFFAGSGTTLHATMQLNAEDGGHRKCILVTNNENNICRDVTYERNKRVINGYTTPKGVEVEGLHNNNLRYYKVDFVPRDLSATGQKELLAASTNILCIKNDLYDEQEMFGSIRLRKHIARYFDDKQGKKMLIIYKVEAIESIVEEIAQMPDDTKIKVYVFSTSNYAMDADFEDVADKVELYAMPAALWNAYKKVLPEKLNAVKEEEENV